jgi:hypothetical protein
VTRNVAILASLDSPSLTRYRRSLVDSVRAQLGNQGEASLHDSGSEQVLQDFLRVASIYWSDAFRAKFQATPFDVLTPELFHACAVRTDEESRVLIYRGFLKTLTYYLELIALRSGITQNLHKLPESVGTPAEFNAVKTIAMLPLLSYIAGKRSNLPRIGMPLHRTAMTDAFNNFAVGLSFVAMHEIGHLELGHVGPGSRLATVTPPLLAQAEELNQFKMEEFEADSFVFQGMDPEKRYFAAGACVAILGMFAHIEIYIGGKSDTHPVSLNRLQHALTGFGKVIPAAPEPVREALGDASRRLLASVERRGVQEDVGWERPIPGDMDSAEEVADFAIETLQSFYREVMGPDTSPEEDDESSRRAKAWDLWSAYLGSDDATAATHT